MENNRLVVRVLRVHHPSLLQQSVEGENPLFAKRCGVESCLDCFSQVAFIQDWILHCDAPTTSNVNAVTVVIVATTTNPTTATTTATTTRNIQVHFDVALTYYTHGN